MNELEYCDMCGNLITGSVIVGSYGYDISCVGCYNKNIENNKRREKNLKGLAVFLIGLFSGVGLLGLLMAIISY